MPKNAVLFAGQGSQYTGMGAELISEIPSLKRVFECGSDILGYDLENLCLNATAEELAKTENSQPAIFAVSVIAFEAIKEIGVTPDMVAGHSLGEYAAMVASGMLSLESGFEVIKARAAAMGKCAQNQDGAMCAIIGLSADEVEAVCRETDGYVLPVNYNSTPQTVIAGERSAVEAAAEKFKEMGKRAMFLAVSAAFHSKLMQPAADEFKAAITSVKFNSPSVPFYSNLIGERLTDFSDMPAYLASHLVSPVLFTKELNAIKNAGAERFIECGPGRVLTGLVNKTLSDVTALNVENAAGLNKLR